MSHARTITAEERDRDPGPVLVRLREEEPVAWVPALRMGFVTRWDDIRTMEDHPETGSAAAEPGFPARTLGENMLTLDPPAGAGSRPERRSPGCCAPRISTRAVSAIPSGPISPAPRGGTRPSRSASKRCLGEWLGRQEIRVGAERLFGKPPGLRLHPEAQIELRGFEFRGPGSVPVVRDV